MDAEIRDWGNKCKDQGGMAAKVQIPEASEDSGSGQVSLDLLADLAIKEGWQRGTGRFIDMLPAQDALRIQKALEPFGQGAWVIFLGSVQKRRMLFVDGSLGSSAIIAARLGANVILLVGSHLHAMAVERRVLEMGVSENIQVLVWRGEEAVPLRDGSIDVACLHNLDAIQSVYPSARMRYLVREMGRILRLDGVLYVSGSKVPYCNKNVINKNKVDGPFRVFREILGSGLRPYLMLEHRDDLLFPYAIHEIPLQIDRFPLVEVVKWAIRSSNYAWIAARPEKMGQARRRSFEARINPFLTGTLEKPLRIFLGSRSVVRLETNRTIVRIPLSEAGVKSCLANHNALVYLGTIPKPFAVPKVLGYIPGEISYFVEDKLEGEPVFDQVSVNKRCKLAENGLSLIEDWHRGVCHEGIFDESIFRSFIGPALDLIRKYLPPGQNNEIMEIEEKFKRRYMGTPMRLSFVHGDFKINNFILGPRGDIVGIVDWDRFQKDAPLTLDGLLLVGYNLMLGGEGSYVKAILALGEHPRERKLLRGHLKNNGVDPDQLPLQQCIAASHIIACNGPTNVGYRSWWNENISVFLRFLKEL